MALYRGKVFSQRSDGFFETSDGQFAVSMRASSGIRGDLKFFRFKTSVMGEAQQVEWPKDHAVQLFPEPVARALISRNFARHPLLDQIEALEIRALEMEPPQSPEEPAPEPALEPAPSPSPEKSEAAPEAAEIAPPKKASKKTPAASETKVVAPWDNPA